MNPWRKTRDEMAGVWRSVRYDFGDRREPAGDEAMDEVTTTGMSTFGGVPAEDPPTGYPLTTAARISRRVTAVSVFGVLAVAGAAGSYFAVVDGLGPLLAGKPVSSGSHPVAEAAPEQPADSNAGLGGGRAGMNRPEGNGAGAAAALPSLSASPSSAAAAAPRPPAGGVKKRGYPTPPVPTPTDARSATPSPSPSDSPSATPSDTPGDDWTFDPEDRDGWPDQVYPWGDRPLFPGLRQHRYR
jgi:hypothetical protein